MYKNQEEVDQKVDTQFENLSQRLAGLTHLGELEIMMDSSLKGDKSKVVEIGTLLEQQINSIPEYERSIKEIVAGASSRLQEYSIFSEVSLEYTWGEKFLSLVAKDRAHSKFVARIEKQRPQEQIAYVGRETQRIVEKLSQKCEMHSKHYADLMKVYNRSVAEIAKQEPLVQKEGEKCRALEAMIGSLEGKLEQTSGQDRVQLEKDILKARSEYDAVKVKFEEASMLYDKNLSNIDKAKVVAENVKNVVDTLYLLARQTHEEFVNVQKRLEVAPELNVTLMSVKGAEGIQKALGAMDQKSIEQIAKVSHAMADTYLRRREKPRFDPETLETFRQSKEFWTEFDSRIKSVQSRND